MGVMACDRKDCENILCDRYNPTYGYICDECFEELVDSDITDINDFMNTSKNQRSLEGVDDRRNALSHIFRE